MRDRHGGWASPRLRQAAPAASASQLKAIIIRYVLNQYCVPDTMPGAAGPQD